MSSRTFPRFVEKLQEVNNADFTPLSYLAQEEAAPFAVCAQWLFSPDFVEYRGGVFRTELPRGIAEADRATLDDWFAHFDGDVAKVERKANLFTFWDLFINWDADQYDEELSQLARTVAGCWDALLRVQFPDRTFRVDVYDSEDSYGPEITFYEAG